MEEAAKDRISNLPEDLLHHILSFLGIKDGARTSVLSQRWKYIWITVPILEFLEYNFTSSEEEKYLGLVDGTLQRHSSIIDKFTLCWYSPLNESRLHSWISTLVRSKVKELSLKVYQEHPLFIPLSLFTCESLMSLMLCVYPNTSLPKEIFFPRLKRLQLHRFNFSDYEELFSNFPVLEELILDVCQFRMRNFCILIPTLKLLKIDVSCDEAYCLHRVFKIDAPRLISFSYSGCAAKEFVLSSFPELAKAAVNIHFHANDAAKEISRLLRRFAHVKCLTVSDETLKVICSTANNLLTFHKVKMLNIYDELTADEGLIALLKAVPNLESLVFETHMIDEEEEEADSDQDDYSDNEDHQDSEDDEDENEGDGDHDSEDDEDEGDVADAAECGSLFSHLKSVCFEQFVGNPRGIRWVELILRNAKALETMTIHCYQSKLGFLNVKSEKELMADIPRFPRASSCCVIKFYSLPD